MEDSLVAPEHIQGGHWGEAETAQWALGVWRHPKQSSSLEEYENSLHSTEWST